MSPLDDELRTLFSDRADRLLPAADPLLGVERRARRIRRNRVAASIGGAAIAVAAIALALPSVLPDRDVGGRSPTPTARHPGRRSR